MNQRKIPSKQKCRVPNPALARTMGLVVVVSRNGFAVGLSGREMEGGLYNDEMVAVDWCH